MSVYVSNLSCNVEEEDLRRVFEKYGTVIKVQVPISKKTGSNKGFGVVEMETHAEEISAIQMLRDTEWMGRFIKVNRARTELEEVSSCHS
jgi:RNA recognition motif-containing protein